MKINLDTQIHICVKQAVVYNCSKALLKITFAVKQRQRECAVGELSPCQSSISSHLQEPKGLRLQHLS